MHYLMSTCTKERATNLIKKMTAAWLFNTMDEVDTFVCTCFVHFPSAPHLHSCLSFVGCLLIRDNQPSLQRRGKQTLCVQCALICEVHLHSQWMPSRVTGSALIWLLPTRRCLLSCIEWHVRRKMILIRAGESLSFTKAKLGFAAEPLKVELWAKQLRKSAQCGEPWESMPIWSTRCENVHGHRNRCSYKTISIDKKRITKVHGACTINLPFFLSPNVQ